MTWQAQEAQNLGPTIDSIGVVAITTSSASTSLATAMGTIPYKMRYITLCASVATYYAFGATGDSIDETATTGSTRCAYLPANTPTRMIATGDYIILKAGGAGLLRIWPSSDG